MRNLRWKLRSLLRLGKRRWIVSWSIILFCDKAVEYFWRVVVSKQCGGDMGGTYLNDLEILDILALSLDHFAGDKVASGLFGIGRGSGRVVAEGRRGGLKGISREMLYDGGDCFHDLGNGCERQSAGNAHEQTYLDEAVGRVAVPEVGYGEELAAGDVLGDLVCAQLHCEEGDCMLLCAVWVCVVLLLDELGVVYFLESRAVGKLIKDVAEGDSEGKEVPEEGYWVC
jgi:hypothetical protein